MGCCLSCSRHPYTQLVGRQLSSSYTALKMSCQTLLHFIPISSESENRHTPHLQGMRRREMANLQVFLSRVCKRDGSPQAAEVLIRRLSTKGSCTHSLRSLQLTANSQVSYVGSVSCRGRTVQVHTCTHILR